MDTGGYFLLFAYPLTDIRTPSESEYLFRRLGFFLWERRSYKTVAETEESDMALSLLRRVVETCTRTPHKIVMVGRFLRIPRGGSSRKAISSKGERQILTKEHKKILKKEMLVS